MASVWAELKRRNVFKVGVAYPGIFRLTKIILAVWIMVAPNGSIAQEDNSAEDAISPLFNDNLRSKYDELCVVCHGEDLTGAAQGTPLVGVELTNGDSIAKLSESIAKGSPGNNMPAFSETLSADQIKNLAIYISEQRSGFDYFDYKIQAALEIPTGNIESELHDFRLETVIDNLDPLPFSIAPLPDGRI
jgi:mono/diheme cytochrome c family protein